ncbi:MAG: hypothetical protein ABIG61_08050 [Planctomycetota bacterium]
MVPEQTITDPQQGLQRLLREDSSGVVDTFSVVSPGAKTTAWAVKVISNNSYNIYNVQAVVIGEPGSLPAVIGQQMQAINLAESFTTSPGSLPEGTYTLMCRVGDKNVFYAPV